MLLAASRGRGEAAHSVSLPGNLRRQHSPPEQPGGGAPCGLPYTDSPRPQPKFGGCAPGALRLCEKRVTSCSWLACVQGEGATVRVTCKPSPGPDSAQTPPRVSGCRPEGRGLAKSVPAHAGTHLPFPMRSPRGGSQSRDRATPFILGLQSIPVEFIHSAKPTEPQLCVGHRPGRVSCRHKVPAMTGVQGEGLGGASSRPREGGGLPGAAQLSGAAPPRGPFPVLGFLLPHRPFRGASAGAGGYGHRLSPRSGCDIAVPIQKGTVTRSQEPLGGTAGPALGSGCRTGRDKKIC